MCLKGKASRKAKPGLYICRKCRAVAKKKAKLCRPKKIQD